MWNTIKVCSSLGRWWKSCYKNETSSWGQRTSDEDSIQTNNRPKNFILHIRLQKSIKSLIQKHLVNFGYYASTEYSFKNIYSQKKHEWKTYLRQRPKLSTNLSLTFVYKFSVCSVIHFTMILTFLPIFYNLSFFHSFLIIFHNY